MYIIGYRYIVDYIKLFDQLIGFPWLKVCFPCNLVHWVVYIMLFGSVIN